MPKDDFDNARRKDRGRKEKALLDREAEQDRRKRLKDFPKHTLRKQPDGSYLSDVYTFSVKRWSHL